MMKRAMKLPEMVSEYLRAAKPVLRGRITPGQYAAQHASQPSCDVEQVSIDDLREMMNEVARGLVARGMGRREVAAVLESVMKENHVTWKMSLSAN